MSVTNLDPEPYHCDRHGGRWGDDQTCYTCVDEHGDTRPTHDGSLCVYDPRPEFDVRNNPLLEIFADLVAHNDGAESLAVLAERFLGEHEHYVELSSVPERQYAEEVLERIVAASV